MNSVGLSIIIVNYNGSRFLNACIESYSRDLNSSKINHEFVIIDNNSTDDSLSVLKSIKDRGDVDIIIIPSNNNNGFAKGNNICVKLANYPYLVLLNNDTKALKIDSLIDLIERGNFDSNTIYTSNILNSDLTVQKNCFNYTSIVKVFIELFLFKNLLTKLLKKTRSNFRYDYFSGCYLILSKSLYNKVLGFDESFFFYHEECDLFMRLDKYNVKKVVLKDQIIHFGNGGGEISESSFVNYYYNLAYLLFKHSSLFFKKGIKFLFIVGVNYRILLLHLRIKVNYNPFLKVYKKNEMKFDFKKSIQYHKALLFKLSKF